MRTCLTIFPAQWSASQRGAPCISRLSTRSEDRSAGPPRRGDPAARDVRDARIAALEGAPVGAIALAIAIVIALVGWGMPLGQTAAATGYGALYGLFPILWILINALFVYRLTVVTGYRRCSAGVIRSVSDDQRILSIVIAFCFGALLESLAGFGAPVAISAAMLLAAGMKPLKAATVSLLANTAPVAFGAMGAPIIALAGVTHLPLDDLAAMAGRQTPFLAALVPLVMVFLVDGKRGVRETWPIAVVAASCSVFRNSSHRTSSPSS